MSSNTLTERAGTEPVPASKSKASPKRLLATGALVVAGLAAIGATTGGHRLATCSVPTTPTSAAMSR
ncbi:hypothetical protein D9M68_80950 [compost metagenome]